jgi:hypothetical protein
MRWTRNAAMTVTGLVLLVACTGSGRGSDVATLGRGGKSPNPRPSQDPEEAFLRFAECMRDRGVEVSDPQETEGGGEVIQFGGEGIDQEQLEQADTFCRHLLPEGTDEPADLSPQEQARLSDRLVRFAHCMREHSIDFPDLDPGSGGFINTPGDPDAPDPAQPGFEEAEEACARFLPDEFSGGGEEEAP